MQNRVNSSTPIFYASESEVPGSMPLGQLLLNFSDSGTEFSAADISDELADRGWWEGVHDGGRYLILNIEKFGLSHQPPKKGNFMRFISIAIMLVGIVAMLAGGSDMAGADTHAQNVEGLWFSLSGLGLLCVGAFFLSRALGRD